MAEDPTLGSCVRDKIGGLVTRRSFGCLGALMGCLAGFLFGLVKGLTRPIDWAISGASIYGPGVDGLQRMGDYVSDAFDWFLQLVGDIFNYSITWAFDLCLISVLISWLVRFVLWFKNHFRVSWIGNWAATSKRGKLYHDMCVEGVSVTILRNWSDNRFGAASQ